MIYMLDSNICIYAQKRIMPVLQKMNECQDGLMISSIVYAELVFGTEKSEKKQQNYESLNRFLENVGILSFDKEAAQKYGELRNYLKQLGTPIGDRDIMIAAHALSLGLPLVTNNTREFERVPGLKLENWLEQPEQFT